MTDEARLAWWKPWRWPFAVGLMVFVVSLVFVAFGVRMYFLSLVPAIDVPFEVAEFIRVADDIPPEENGGENYRRANEMYRQELDQLQSQLGQAGIDSMHNQICSRWADADETTRSVVERLLPSLLEWRAGTEKQHGQVTPLAAREYVSMGLFLTIERSHQFQSVEGLSRKMVRLAVIEASRLEEEGDFEGAWRWYRTVYLNMGHLARRNALTPRLIGNALHFMMIDRVVEWAENPNVTPEQLRKARDDVRATVKEIGPMSDTLKAEYISFEVGLHRGGWPRDYVALPGTKEWQEFYVPAVGPLLSIVGEPELTRRIYRHALANHLKEIDKPFHETSPQASAGQSLLFDRPHQFMEKDELSSAVMIAALNQSFVAQDIVLLARFQDVVYRERALFQLIDVCLALQLYKREHGQYPETLDHLVPKHLDSVPFDPLDPAGLPIRYRREQSDRAVLWSIGINHKDDDGDIGWPDQGGKGDLGWKLK